MAYSRIPATAPATAATYSRLPSLGETPYYYQGRNPLLHYWLDESSGNLTDKGSLGVTVTKLSTPVYSQPSKVSGSSSILFGDFGGATAGRFSSASGLTMTLGATDSFTLFLRYQVHPANDEAWTYAFLFECYTAGNPALSVSFDASERLICIVKDDSGTQHTMNWGKATPYTTAKGKFVDAAIVFDRLATEVKLYIDGSLVSGSKANSDFNLLGALTFSGARLNIGCGYAAIDTSDFHGWIDEVWLCKGLGWYDNVNQQNILSPQRNGLIHYVFDVASGNVSDTGTTPVGASYHPAVVGTNPTNLQYRQTADGASMPYKISNVYTGSGSKGYFASASPPHGDLGLAAADDFIQLIQVGFPADHDLSDWSGHFGLFNLYNVIGGTDDSDFDSYFQPATPAPAEWSTMFKDGAGNRHQVHLQKADGYDLLKDGQIHEVVWVATRTAPAVRCYIDGIEQPSWVTSTFSMLTALVADSKLDGGRSMMTVDQLHTNWMGGSMAEYWLSKGTDWYRNYPAYYTTPTTVYNRQGGTPLLHYKFLEPATDGYLMNYGSVNVGKLSPHGTFTRSVPAPDNLWYGIKYAAGASNYKNPTLNPVTIGTNDFTVVVWADISTGITGVEKYMWRFANGANNTVFFGWIDVATQKFKVRINDATTGNYVCEVAKADFYDLLLTGPKEVAFIFDRSETTMVCKVNNVSKTVTNTTGTLSGISASSLEWNGIFMGAFTIGDTFSYYGTLYEYWLSTGLTYTSNF